MKQKISKIIENDKRIAIAVDGNLASIALLDMAVNILGEDDVIGFSVVTEQSSDEYLELLEGLQANYPLIILKVEYNKLKDNQAKTNIEKSKVLSIILQKIMHQANLKGFATVYSGLTADNKNSFKVEVINNLQVIAPFIEVNAYNNDIKAMFSYLLDNL